MSLNGLTTNRSMINHTPNGAASKPLRLFGFLCEKGAYTYFEVSSSVPRKLPRHFVALPVVSIAQIKTEEVLKAFLAGAVGVLIAGCEHCRSQYEPQSEGPLAAIQQALTRNGIEPERLRLEWISAGEETRFIELVNEMAAQWSRLPPPQFRAGIEQTISHCG